MTTIVRHTRFKLNPFGDGGSKRSVQIQELLERSGMEFVNDEFRLPKALSIVQKISLFYKGLTFVIRLFSWNEIGGIGNLMVMSKYFGIRIPIVLDHYSQADVIFLNEDTTSGAYGLPYLMKAAGKQIITVPHNIESFCGSDIQSGKKSTQWLYEDIKRLKMSDHVFCISKEETWLLRLFGLNADYLPYFPPTEVEDYLKGIRLRREKREPNLVRKCLMLGSATNHPTKVGMEQLLRWFAQREILPFELHIAGFATERLSNITHPKFHFHGAVSKNQLEMLLVESDCMIINQFATSGALTRIMESLVAGVPIIANLNAARDYFGTEGVVVFQTFDDLYDLLEGSELPQCVRIPERNKTAERIFLDTIIPS